MFAANFDTPTTCAWLGKSSKEFVTGFTKNNKLVVFDA